jgi:hypothetical protein
MKGIEEQASLDMEKKELESKKSDNINQDLNNQDVAVNQSQEVHSLYSEFYV